MALGTDRGGRLPHQPHFDVDPPSDDVLAAVVAALDSVLLPAGFRRHPLFNLTQVEGEKDRLHIRAAWDRDRLIDDAQYYPQVDGWIGGMDGVSCWGSGLIRGDAGHHSFELLVRSDTAATLIAASVRAFIQAADYESTR